MGNIWTCKVGERAPRDRGADAPMRAAVEVAFEAVTGHWPDFVFSGWGGELREADRAVVEGRLPVDRSWVRERARKALGRLEEPDRVKVAVYVAALVCDGDLSRWQGEDLIEALS